MSMKSSSASASSSQDRLHRMETFPDDDEGHRGKESAVHPLLSLYLDQALTDVLLTTASNTSVAAHKVVLAAHSAYFRAIFAGASSGFCVENSRSVVRVENVDDETLHLLLRLMYGGDRLDALPEESQRLIPRLMDAAAYLSVECVVKACSTYLLETLRVGNAIDVYLLSAGRPEYAIVHEGAMKFIISNFSAILRSWEGAESLCHLSKDDVLHVLCGRHADCIHKGVDIVMALLLYTRCEDWRVGEPLEDRSALRQANAAGDVEDIIRRLGRETYRDEYSMALNAIRDLEKEAGAPLLLSDESVDRVGVALFGPDTPRLFGATIDGADDEHGGGNARRSAFERHVEARNHPITNGNTIIAVGGIHSGWKAVRSTELYNIDTDTWVPGPDMPTDCSFSHACTLSSGETYIPVTKSSSMLQYVAQTRATPSPAEPSPNPTDVACQWRIVDTYDGNVIQRASSAAVALGEDIHVLGGRPIAGRDCHPVSLHQCFRSGRWQTLAPMNEPRASMDVCVTLGRIWCVGGQSLRQTHASMEWYEPANDCWFTSSSKLATPRKYATVNAFSDTSPGCSQIIIMGGMNDVRTRLASVEAYDPREGRLRALPPLPRPLSSAASCCSGYHLYIMGGRVDRQGTETDAMWSYDVRGGSWMACRSMRQARSSLCCFLA